MLVQLTDSRRLTGGNLYWDRPSAIIDCATDGDPTRFIEAWRQHVLSLLPRVGHAAETTTSRRYQGGASLLVSAPIDALYSMCELNELAFQAALDEQETVDPAEVARLDGLFQKEANPALLTLQAAANDHGAPFLWDDDAVSVGQGANATVWAPDALPSPDAVDWQAATGIPVALVTGTNGKSTTVRMAATILAAAGRRAGLTSTDWIRVGDTILDTGDYSGTGGARTLLRHPETEVAVLETARGGLLRRGLGVDRASAALITNVAADHLGDYGIHTVPELIEAKFIVRRALHDGAPLILNADDAGIVAFARSLDQPLVWFSLDHENPVVQAHVAAGGQAAVLRSGWLEWVEDGQYQGVLTSASMPSALAGAARHNIANALAALALCQVLGIDPEHQRAGLQAFSGNEADNPGRGNWFEKNGVRILVDFAHNEHGMRAQADMLALMPAERRILLMSQAGDRLDGDIQDMVHAACAMRPERLLVCELPGYERGREPGDVSRVIVDAATSAGVSSGQIERFPNPREAVASALANARTGDLLALFVLTQRDEVLALVHEFLDAN